MVWVDLVGVTAELLGDSLSGGQGSASLSIPIVLLTLDHFNDRLVDDLWQVEAVGLVWLTKSKVDHWKWVVLGWVHLLLEDLSDRIEYF